MITPESLVDLVEALDPLADLPRTGWVLRGVSDPESIADHSFSVCVVSSLLVDMIRARGEKVDGEKTLRMALIHDAAEAQTGDVPLPSKTPEMQAALHTLEEQIVTDMLPASYLPLGKEGETGDSLEARIVKAADKIQMMVKVVAYERKRGAHLEDFWHNPGNFRVMGIPEARTIYEIICSRAGRQIPQLKDS